MQINAGSIERDCPEPRQKRAKDTVDPKERRRDRDRVIYGREEERRRKSRRAEDSGEHRRE